MKVYKSDSIRNVALIGHSGEGKTSLAEAMLYAAKSIDRLGKVDDGTSTMDYDSEEISRRISINLALGYLEWADKKINIIDVPGFFDFEGEMTAALHVVESAVIVTSASGSLTVGTEKALEACMEKGVPALIFVNGVHKENSDFEGTLNAITEKYGKKIIPIEYPIIEGGKITGYVCVLSQRAFTVDGKEIEIPANLKDKVSEYSAQITELIAETDEELMNKFFEGEEFTPEERRKGLLGAILGDGFVPLMAGNATSLTCVPNLLNRIVELMPSPLDFRGKQATINGEAVEVKCDPDKPFSAQVFKSITDQFVGKLNYIKVNTGKLSVGDSFVNKTAEKSEKAGALYLIKGKKQETISELYAGDIGALAKLVYTSTNDTIADSSYNIVYEQIKFPEPVLSLAVGAAKSGDEEKIIQGLIKMQEEDMTFKVEKNVETGDILISGLGEAQLDIMCKRVKNKFGVEAKLSDPKVAYRETIRRSAEAEGKHKKQSGGAGQYGVVQVRFEPGAADGNFEFVDAIVGGAVPRQFIPAVEKGLLEAIKSGVLAGYPTINIKATLYDGKYHPVDSKEIAFIMAAKLAYQEALPKADPCFLEPIMEVVITIPDSYLGDIMGDMNKRRGRILGTDSFNGKAVVTAEVPQAELFKYATDLRSMTQGRGKFTMKFVRYEEVPAQLTPKIIEDAKKRKEAEAK